MQAGTNYIYIVFAVLYVIYSIIKAGKKTARQKPATQKREPDPTVHPRLPSKEIMDGGQDPTASPLPQSNPGDDLKKMLEELLGGVPEIKTTEKQPDPDREQKPEPAKIKPQPAKIVTHAQKIKAAPSHIPSPKGKASPKTKEEEKTFLSGEKKISKKVFTQAAVGAEQDSDADPEDFDIRRAVIYSEILKRPEW